MKPDTYSWAEMMAVAISREMRDGYFGAVGAAAHIPMAALRLAQLTHAPNLSFMCGGSGGLNPHFERLAESSSDYRNLVNSEFRYSLEDVVDLETAMRLDFAFVGGMQIDRYGNVNMTVIGDWAKPKVRGPGTVGLIFLGGFRRTYLYTEHHSPKVLVEKVDFVSGAGWLGGGDERSKVFREGSDGPQRVFTPLGVFDFDPVSRHMRLLSVHPGRTVEEVRAATGFELPVPEGVGDTPEPTAEELDILRRHVDRDGVLRALGAAR
ncbi:CoA-transferase subunit beta [Phytohabitans flavus]|uniref:3-oxoadipate--succinyl-CoA transferase subunit B n=1 Tax=Phytohabitans flavus TaxID=1076124 RepID=A0A6F8XS63_9ACTN|nr:CoA-transferase [Phytohabitans flavus]BCB76674.1 3-oxoadipate--succinyl-CoA transferase subunit B [Phytohabitans flavus]